MANLSELIRKMLQLCGVKNGDRVVLMTSHRYDEYYINFYRTVLNNLETDYVHMIIPPQAKQITYKDLDTRQLVLSRFNVDLLKNADFILNVREITRPPFPWASMYQPEFNEIISKTRWLDVMIEKPEINIPRLFPTEALISRTIKGAEILAKARNIKITSEAGTFLTMENTKHYAHAQYGLADGLDLPCGEKHNWDNFGFGLVAFYPKLDSVNGTLILESGDYILKLQRDVVDPVKITFKDGYAKKIEGGFTAKLLQRWFDRWEDPEVYGVAHVGWGTHKEGAVWTDSLYFCVADAESYPGVMQIGVGATSDRPSLGHCDIECRHCNIYLDNELIVKDGEIVNPQCS